MQGTRLRVVVDTNVWISAMLNTAGVPGQLGRWVLRHGLAVFSNETFAELAERIWRPKFDRYVSMERRKALLADLSASGHWVEVPPITAAKNFCRDASDDKFFHLAIAAGATFLVTGDQDLLVLADALCEEGVHVLTPAEALLQPDFSP